MGWVVSVGRVGDSVLLLLVFGCLTGVTTVLFGFGGGFVTVPVVYAFTVARSGGGVDAMHVAVATSAAVMVVNSVGATLAQARSGRLRREYLWPLGAWVAVGAAAGALGAVAVGDAVQRVLFAVYLGVTILDSVVRRGFVAGGVAGAGPRPLGRVAASAGGVGIGAVASVLEVGGSVMTVPLLRRRGVAMADAAAMANPLSVPVAVVGTAVYALVGSGAAPGHVGYVDVVAAGLLLAGSLPAIAVVRRVVGRVPDRVHAVAYIGLLVVVLVAIVVV
nr:sulfite exporter TauE/SafE family protein [Murinocardiopsis flavida]